MFFFGCKGNKSGGEISTNAQTRGTIKMCVTFYPLYIMLQNITDGVAGVELSLLAPSQTGCLHDYEPSVRDMKTIADSDVLIANGADMEQFLERALEHFHGTVIVASDGFEIVDGNAHIWVSPKGAIYEVNKIADSLAEADASRATLYKANASRYVSELEKLLTQMHDALDKFSGAEIITFHEAFPYFAHEFGFEIVSVVEREPGTVPNARELSETVSLIKRELSLGKNIKLFAEPEYASSAADIIATETAQKIFLLDPCVTGKLQKDAYIDAMTKNTEVLSHALSQ